MAEDIFIACKDVSIGYRDRTAPAVEVKANIHLRALKGEMVALIGGNGVGKSTLLKTLAGFQPPLSGQLLIHNRPATEFTAAELAREMSFVSTEVVRAARLTVRELVGLGRYPYTDWFGQLTEKDREIIGKAIHDVGLSGYEERLVSRISDGERQRAMIARALAQDTQILVLDEPTAFLDISNKYEIVSILHRLVNQQGKCIIFSTHDLHTALSMADRIWLMLEGEVVEGIPEEIAAQGYFDALFPKNQHLKFDLEKGDFSLNREPIGTVALSANGSDWAMVARVMERLGFATKRVKPVQVPHPINEILKPISPSENKTLLGGSSGKGNPLGEIYVTQIKNGWLISYPGFSLEAESLEALCRILKQLMLLPGS